MEQVHSGDDNVFLLRGIHEYDAAYGTPGAEVWRQTTHNVRFGCQRGHLYLYSLDSASSKYLLIKKIPIRSRFCGN